jgi:hypothetical protein
MLARRLALEGTMPVQAQSIIARVRTQLIDNLVTKRWSDDELLSWLSDGQRTCVSMDPSLGDVTDGLKLAVGTLQTLPDTAFMLLDVIRNLGTTGTTPGRVVTPITRENLDRTDPNWHFSRRSEVTQHFIYDPRNPLLYYVYPPSTGSNYLEVSRAENPPDITSLTAAISIPDLYQTPLFDYTMFRAHQKDSDYAAGDQKAQAYLQLFQMFFVGHTSAIDQQSPSKSLGAPDMTGAAAA